MAESLLRLAAYFPSRLGSLAPDLPPMCSPGRGSLMASLRCLSALSSCSSSTSALDTSPAAVVLREPAAGRVRAHQYEAFLDHRISASVSRLLKSLDALGSRPSEGGPAVVVRGAPAAPPPHRSAVVQPLTAAAVALEAPPVQPRKRSAFAASLGDAAAPTPAPPAPPRQPTSSIQAAPNLSDGCTTMTAPGQPLASAEECGAVSCEPAVEQRLFSGAAGAAEFDQGRSPAAAAVAALAGRHGGAHSGAQPEDRQFLAPQPAAAGHKRQRQQHEQPEGPIGPPCLRGSGPTAAATRGSSSGARPPLGAGSGLREEEGLGSEQRRALLESSCTGAVAVQAAAVREPVPVYGGTLYPPTLAPVRPRPGEPVLTPPQLQGQQQAACRPIPHPGREAVQPVAEAVPPGQPFLCGLPPPSVTLQGLLGRRPTAAPLACSSAFPRQEAGRVLMGSGAQQPGPPSNAPPGAERVGFTALAPLLESANPQVWALVQRTAAATAAYQQAQAARLPAMEAVLQRWPVDSLVARLGLGAGGVDDGAAQPAMRFVSTALPRRRSVAELSLPLQRGQGQPAPLAWAALAASGLPADACSSRKDLWDLYEQFDAPAVPTCGQQGVDGSYLCPEGTNMAAAAAAATAGHGRGSGAGWDAAAARAAVCNCECHRAAEAAAACSQTRPDSDDSDVYITDQGLVCLASLVGPRVTGGSGVDGGGGWRLPFLVKQHIAGQGGDLDEPGLHGTGAPCCAACGCASAHQRQGPAVPPVLVFTDPLLDEPRLLQHSWMRVCGHALAAQGICSSGGGDGAAAGDTRAPELLAGVEEDADECPYCQQDEWQLGGLSLLVLSHCHVGRVTAGGSGSGGVRPVQLVPLAAPAGGSSAGSAAEGGRGCRAVDLRAALTQPEAVYRAELLSSDSTTLVVSLDPATGGLLGEHRLDRGALFQLAAESGATSQDRSHWRFVQDLLVRLRRLPPGPYVLSWPAAGRYVELRGLARYGC